jgi:hypothetical protein
VRGGEGERDRGGEGERARGGEGVRARAISMIDRGGVAWRWTAAASAAHAFSIVEVTS